MIVKVENLPRDHRPQFGLSFADVVYDNSIQPLDGMKFDLQLPIGKPAGQIFARYSRAIYNRWDYDPESGRYLRFVDAQDDVNRNYEVYFPMLE